MYDEAKKEGQSGILMHNVWMTLVSAKLSEMTYQKINSFQNDQAVFKIKIGDKAIKWMYSYNNLGHEVARFR